jgi:DHA1 family bicyclomycin/chloramphenicol resistance-like MFS transporter
VNNILLERYSSEQVISAASGCQSIIGLVMVFNIIRWSHLFLTVFLIFIFLASGFIFPNATALALAPLGHNAGNASALIGAIQLSIGASASAIVSVLQNHTALPMAGVMTCCALAAFAVYKTGSRFLGRNADQKALKLQGVEMATEL